MKSLSKKYLMIVNADDFIEKRKIMIKKDHKAYFFL